MVNLKAPNPIKYFQLSISNQWNYYLVNFINRFATAVEFPLKIAIRIRCWFQSHHQIETLIEFLAGAHDLSQNDRHVQTARAKTLCSLTEWLVGCLDWLTLHKCVCEIFSENGSYSWQEYWSCWVYFNYHFLHIQKIRI